MEDYKLCIKGVFETHDFKGDEHTPKYCKVTDNGDFECILSYTPNEVTINTTVNAKRNIEGKDLDVQNTRDAFFTCLTEGKKEGTIYYTEHFVKIANGTRLLHFSEEYENFEIFELPKNWFIENGITGELMQYPKVFDDVTYDLEDKDLEEVLEILSTRRKIDKATLTKKITN